MDSCARLIGSVVPWRREARLRKRSSRFTSALLLAISQKEREREEKRNVREWSQTAVVAESRVVISTCARQDGFIDVSRAVSEARGVSKLCVD